MVTTQTQKTKKRELLTKKPFYRINAVVGSKMETPTSLVGEQPWVDDDLKYDIVTQADFMRELDPNSHAINDTSIYQNWVQNDEDGLYYETQWERHAFAFQQEILEDRLVRLTGNDIQFDLSGKIEDKETREDFYNFKGAWAEHSMERAWYSVAKSTLATGDAAFVGILSKGKFSWKTFSFLKGDRLYPHYDKRTGKLAVFARTYSDYGDDGNVHKYIDAWDEKNYYRFVDSVESSDEAREEGGEETTIGDFLVSGYALEERTPHGFDRIPVAYRRCDTGPCWSNSQETIEHYELAFSRLAQSNSAFGLPILSLTSGNGKNIEDLSMGDMSYAAKIFLLPSDGKAEFLQRQDASNAYKAQLDELKRKIYEMSMVVKSPELKSGDTPAAAIKLLYSDSYNKGMNETQEFDECIDDMVDIFAFGAGVEREMRLKFVNLPISHWIQIFIPISEGELASILATGVQNKFCSKQTASEKFPYATPQEWSRILQERHDEQAEELMMQEQRIEIQNDANVEMQEQLAEIETQQQAQPAQATGAKASTSSTNNSNGAPKAVIKKGSGSSGGRRGRPKELLGVQWDDNRNKINPATGKAYSKWNNQAG